MFRKITCITLFAFIFIFPTVFADELNINVNVDYNTDILTIMGTNIVGSIMAVCVEGTKNNIEFISDIAIINNELLISFRLTGTKNGIIKIRLKSDSMVIPYLLEFNYQTPYNDSSIEKNERIVCTQGNNYNFTLYAEDICDFDKTFTLSYNVEFVELVDLCSLTHKTDLGIGKIKGTDIEVIEFEPSQGYIVFKVNKDIEAGDSYKGILNVIKFNSLQSGQSILTLRQNQ